MQQRETLQDRVYADILTRIHAGEWPDKSALPTLEALGRQYQVGDNSIRLVIARLKENGYLTTQRGRPARIVWQGPVADVRRQAASSSPLAVPMPEPLFSAIYILFPALYTHASCTCNNSQLQQLNRLLSPTDQKKSHADTGTDYVELQICFFKTVFSSIKNHFIRHILQSVMPSTVLPAALLVCDHEAMRGAFMESVVVMRRVYNALLEKDVASVKKGWVELFAFLERMVAYAAIECPNGSIKARPVFPRLADADEFKYVAIAYDLYEKILEGKYPVGTFLPTLSQAQARYGAAKITIQSAYLVLSDFGIVKTIHGRGSKVLQLTLNNLPSLDEETFHTRKRQYLETIECLQIVCEDIILNAHPHAFAALRAVLESPLNPSRQYSALILCRYLMKESNTHTLDSFYQAVSKRLYWGSGFPLENKHAWCLEIVDALERKQTNHAVARTKKLLSALYTNAQEITHASDSTHQ